MFKKIADHYFDWERHLRSHLGMTFQPLRGGFGLCPFSFDGSRIFSGIVDKYA